MSIHSVARAQAHLSWDPRTPPVLTISSGDTVSFDCQDASNGQLTPSSTADSVKNADFTLMDQVNGPIFVSGAKAGDVLKVEVLQLKTADWGWTAVIPGFGLLANEFDEATIRIWRIDHEEGVASCELPKSERTAKVPVRPFMGEMGVARGEPGKWSTIPPYRTGGNMDTKHFTQGSTVYLPIEAEGALFSIGDGHAAQGDGEVCGTAIETPMKVTVRLTVLSAADKPHVVAPHYETTNAVAAGAAFYGTTGVGPDLREAARAAVRGMIAHLVDKHGFAREDAYMFCSVAGDLRLHEVVDMPNYVVGMTMPQALLS
ncbi:acetamidase/formamidase [Auricularia subglabra TFB-10046 SS5]|nr:acetamidase/formamidase [Auricularia subglabra TFB-10046 SS5]